jgi:DNA (cytosine-5)-methyltransferase 1
VNVGSCFSGVGGLDLGLHRAGFRHAFFCESDPYRREILARHWPGVPRGADIRGIQLADGGRLSLGDGQYADCTSTRAGSRGVDLLCGGFPCQDLSVAGRRRGLIDGERSSLFFEFARIADALRPEWLLIENVPGLFSSNGGRDFGELLGTLADIGYGVGWRTLDSRFFGVPQRRRRVFILGNLAGGRAGAERCAEVLSLGSGCERHSQARSQAGPRVAASLSRGSSSAGVSAPGRRQEDDENIVGSVVKRYGKGTDSDATDPFVVAPVAWGSSGAGGHRIGAEEAAGGHLVAIQDGRAIEKHQNGAAISDEGVAYTLDGTGAQAVAHTLRAEGFNAGEDGTGRGTPLIADGVRATSIAARHLDDPDWPNPRPDGPRYAACGDAVTANVAEWIGRRLIDYERGNPMNLEAA